MKWSDRVSTNGTSFITLKNLVCTLLTSGEMPTIESYFLLFFGANYTFFVEILCSFILNEIIHLIIFIIDPSNSAVAKILVNSDQWVSYLRAIGDLEQGCTKQKHSKDTWSVVFNFSNQSWLTDLEIYFICNYDFFEKIWFGRVKINSNQVIGIKKLCFL